MDLSGAAWRTSSYSGGNGGQCVEVAAVISNQDESGVLCAVRDSTDPESPILAFSPRQWRQFTAGIKAGRPGPA